MRTTHLVQMSGQATEFEQFVSFKLARQLHVVEVIEAVNGVSKGHVVFFLDEELVVRLINGLDIQLQIIWSMGYIFGH